MNKPEFLEDFKNPAVDPLYTDTMDFDFAEVERQLGESVLDDDEAAAKVSEAFLKLFALVAAVDLDSPRAVELMGRRFLALTWVMNPSLLEGSPSLTSLSKRIGMRSMYPMTILTGEVTRTFGIKNRAQAHAWNRKGKA